MMVTFTGVDNRTEIKSLPMTCEMAVLYSVTRSNQPNQKRYPYPAEAARILSNIGGRKALHLCGKEALMQACHGTVPNNILGMVDRVQVNGDVGELTLEFLCEAYPEITFITQNNKFNEPLLASTLKNHAILVDDSGGRGVCPDTWIKPRTSRPVGFAGGIAPNNVVDVLRKIRRVADDGWWIDMETGVRNSNDRFCWLKARSVIRSIVSSQI